MERMKESPLALYQAHLEAGELAYQWSPEANRGGILPARHLPFYGQRPSRMAGERGSRDGLRHDGHPST